MDITSTLITALTSSSFVSLIMYLITRYDKKKDEEKANTTAQSLMIRGLCHDKILNRASRYVTRGGITLREKTNLRSIYEPYHDAGGNGDCEEGWNACEELPIITEQRAKELDAEIKRKELGL